MIRLPGIASLVLAASAAGTLLGCAVAIALIATDAGGLSTLLGASANPTAPIILLLFGFATLFGSLFAGSAIMLLPGDAHAEIWQRIREADARSMAAGADAITSPVTEPREM